jgi:signal transduction histidine kinase
MNQAAAPSRHSLASSQSELLPYSGAMLITALLLAMRVFLRKWVEDSDPFLFFAPGVVFSAWYGGLGPGLVATIAGAAAARCFLSDPHGLFSIASMDVPKLVVFLVAGTQISCLSGALRLANVRAEADARAARQGERLLEIAQKELQAAHVKLEERVRERTAELAFQKTLLEAQSNASADGILVISEDAQVLFANQRLAELWNLPRDAFGKNLTDAVAAMRQRLTDPRQPICDGQIADADAPAALALTDGRALEYYNAPVRSAEGKHYGHVWFFRDVTERRRVAKQILEAGERERQRIGQDLHDDLCQHLAGITFLGRVLQQRLDAKLPDESKNAARIVDLIEQAIRRARDLAHGLQPVELESDGLGAALAELGATVQSMFPVRCHFRGENAVPLEDDAASIHLYRIAQEAINNAIRHGKAKNIYIDLFNLGGRVRLSIEDDGIGIDKTPSGSGLGLRTMETRARMIGGTLTIEPADGAGTLVTCQLPIREGTEQHERPISQS